MRTRLRKKQFTIGFLISILLLLTCQWTHAQATDDRIVFISDRDGSPKVYTMQSDGSDVQLIRSGVLEQSGDIISLTVSPDGSMAAFVSRKNRDGIYPTDELFLLDLRTGNVIQLTHDKLEKINPLWLSDNTSIIYLSAGAIGYYNNISLINIMTRQVKIIADENKIAQSTSSQLGVGIFDFTLSPDEQRLIASIQTSLPDAYNVLVLMNIDGSHIYQVTPDNAISFSPLWSADSNIVYYGCVVQDNDEICRINLQTSESQILTNTRNSIPGEQDHYIVKMDISPTNQIVFQLQNIYVFNPDDGSITNLTQGDASNNQLLGWLDHPRDKSGVSATSTP